MDNEYVVFSAFTSVPVKQIIADLARPVAIIYASSTSAGVFNKFWYLSQLLLLLF